LFISSVIYIGTDRKLYFRYRNMLFYNFIITIIMLSMFQFLLRPQIFY